jgi:hypothetical protein
MNTQTNNVKEDKSFLLASKISRKSLIESPASKICRISKLKANAIIVSGLYKHISRIGAK